MLCEVWNESNLALFEARTCDEQPSFPSNIASSLSELTAELNENKILQGSCRAL